MILIERIGSRDGSTPDHRCHWADHDTIERLQTRRDNPRFRSPGDQYETPQRLPTPGEQFPDRSLLPHVTTTP